jgi:hypothetical protein
LDAKQKVDEELWTRHVGSLEQFLDEPRYLDVAKKLKLPERLRCAKEVLSGVKGNSYIASLKGTIGRQPL